MSWSAGTSTAARKRRPRRRLILASGFPTTSSRCTGGVRRWSRARREAPMHKISIALAALVTTACAGSRYKAPDVPVPAGYDVGNTAPQSARTTGQTGIAATPPSVQISETPALAPFWVQLGDTTLITLVREAQRSNLDVHIAESRLLSARASRRLARFDLVPTITGT